MPGSRILIVEDERIARENMAHILSREGYRVEAAPGGREALRLLAKQEFDLVVTDLIMPEVDGLAVLQEVKSIWPETEVLMITGHAKVDTAVMAMQKGAYHYLAKPYSIEELRLLVAKALEKRALRLEVVRLRQETGRDAPRIIGNSPLIIALRRSIAQVAPVDSSVLIIGETGTGKELVARAIHDQSRRRKGRFLAVNCAAFSEELLANELFGHEKGAFTGAGNSKMGLLESAHQGTFFLDEIGDMSLNIQAKMLRVIEERIILRVGGLTEIPLDVRFVAATNKDLKKEVEEGNFRQDLFFRLNVIALRVPPLAKRREDIPLLASYFLHKHARAMNKPAREISQDALTVLDAYEFPGNVRELENIMERAVVLANHETILPGHLPSDLQQARMHIHRPDDGGLVSLKENERRHIFRVLEETDGNRTLAAKILDIDRASLWRKLKRWGVNE